MKISMKREQNSACIGSAERSQFGAMLKTKNIFKSLAFAMLMPAMLLTTGCSNDDFAVKNDNNDNTAKQGYTIPVTVNVTREGDEGTMRATYNATDKKLEFSMGDKLFVEGWKLGPGQFAGTLTWVSGTTFTGTIATGNEYTGTADELFSGASPVSATLLPADYGTFNYLSISGTYEHSKKIQINKNKPFATLKATAVEQFSKEQATSYSSGFALSPQNAILNFTIAGLTASTAVDVALTGPSSLNITGSVTTDGSGKATFAMALEGGADLNDYSLTVGGNAIPLVSSSKTLEAGHIYNIGRNASLLASVTTSDVGKVIGADGNIYDNVEAAKTASTTACAIIAYVGSETGESAPYNHGLAIAMKDANNAISAKWMWNDSEPHYSIVNPNQYTDIADALAAKESGSSLSSGKNTGTHPAFQAALANSIATETGISAAAPATGTSGWFMPSIFQWNQIVNGLTGTTTPFTTSTNSSLSYTAVNPKITAAGGVGLNAHYYWSSTEYDFEYAWKYAAINGKAQATPDRKGTNVYIRAAFAF